MSSIQDLISEAKGSGWSDPEIASYLYSQYPKQVQEARKAGYKDQDVFSKVFGLDLTPPKDLNIDQLVSDSWTKNIAKKYPDLDPKILRGLISHESSDNPYALGEADPKDNTHAKGLGQLTDSTAKALGVKNPFDPAENVDAASRRLLEALDRQKGDVPKALMDYHGGPNTANWGPRTQAYPGLVQKATAAIQSPDVAALPAAAPAPAGGPPQDLDALVAATQHALAPPIAGGGDLHGPAPTAVADYKAPWNAGDVVPYGLSLGTLPRMGAALSAARGGISDILDGASLSEALHSAYGSPSEENPFTKYHGNYYRQARTLYDQAHRKFAEENPNWSLLGETASSLPTQIAGLELGGAGANALAGKALGAASPAVSRIGSGVMDFLSGEAGAGPGTTNWLTRRASQAAAGGVTGVGSAALTSGMSELPLEDQLQTGALIGQLGGLGSPAVKRLMATLPPKASAAIANMANRAEELGIDLKTSNVFNPSKTSRTPSQVKQFSDAVAKTFGAPDLTPEGMAAAKSTLQSGFNDVATKTGWIRLGGPFDAKLQNIEYDALRGLTEGEMKPFNQILTDLRKESSTGGMSGTMYQRYTKSDSPLKLQAAKGNPYAKQVLGALEDELVSSAPPGLQQELSDLRKKWFNMKTVEPVVEKNASGEGLVDPKALFNRASTYIKDFGYGGGGDIADLARIGGTFLSRQAPEKGWIARNILPRLGPLGHLAGGAGLGAALSEHLIDPETAVKLIGAYGGAKAAQFAGGRVFNSPVVRNALIDHSLGVPGTSKLVPALTAGANEAGEETPFKGFGR